MKWSGLIRWVNICHSYNFRGIGIYGCGMKRSDKLSMLGALQNKVGEMVMDQILSCPCELKNGTFWHWGEK